MKSYLLRTVALPALFAAGPAMGQGLPASPYNWTGFYLGVNAGANWARSDATTSASSAVAPGFGFAHWGPADLPIVNGIGTGTMTGSGFTGGAQAGYNWQFNSAVVGLEVDYGAFDGKASRTATGSALGSGAIPTITSSVDANWLFTARGRLGWAFNNLLPYVTGGVAVTHLSAATSYSEVGGGAPPSGTGAWSASKTKAGWVVGGGVEWAFAQHWSVRAEYLHVRFNAIDASGLVSSVAYGGAINTKTDLSADIARAGLSYKF